jgi:negative regulator of sigma E activity
MTPATHPAIPNTLSLFKAGELARQGMYREAEALLGGAANPPEDPVLLHALAAVVTQQGDYERARRLWRLLQTRQPGHREAERMLAAIETWEERPAWVRFAPAGAAALLVLGVTLWALSSSGGKRAPVNTSAGVTQVAPTVPVRAVAVSPVAVVPAAQKSVTPEPAPVVMFKVAPAKPAKK